MTPAASLARIEARHLARSPLLWLALAFASALTALEMSWFLPALAGDALSPTSAAGSRSAAARCWLVPGWGCATG